MSSLKLSRRNFLTSGLKGLAYVGAGTAMFDTFLQQTLFKKLSHEAFGATDTHANEYNYIHLSLPGGPPRWYFDLPLNPTGSTSTKVFNPIGFGNWLDVSGGQTKSINKYFKYGSLYLPPIWGESLNGTSFTSVLDSSLFIRGMNMEIDNHQISNGRQVAPLVGGLSLSGLFADQSTKPIAGLTTTSIASTVFKSRNGAAALPLDMQDGLNPLEALLRPFQTFSSSAKFQAPSWFALREQALAQFDAYAKSIGASESALRNAYDSASEMIQSGTYALSTKFDDVRAKYQSVIDEAINFSEVAKLFPKELPTSDIPDYTIEAGVRVVSKDLRTAFNGAGGKPVVIDSMALQFAATEILLGNDLSSSFTLTMLPFDNLLMNGKAEQLGHDQHTKGRIVSTLVTNVYYRAFIGCLSKHVDFLKASGKFDRTIIHIGAEFNRSARADAMGSDHGPAGSNATLISGMIKKNSLVGNIKVNTGLELYPGTWGYASNYSLGGLDRAIQVNDVAITIANMANIDTRGLVTNGRGLLDVGTGLPQRAEANNV